MEALQLPENDRAVYLDRACGDDATLRKRLETLLRSHESAGDFLEETSAPHAGVHSRPAIGVKPGDQVGRYKILQSIGEGGCGVVFRAWQEVPIRREVALKVIKPGMDTRSVIARFEAERQVLAMMDHPHIAKVYDAGACENGLPYFVMELVSGVKLTTYCDEHALDTCHRLNLFIQVCQAVQHAHQKGIIHRDLKPSNILVTSSADGMPLPKVIDFGIAKAITDQPLTDKTVFTAFEMLIGTPAYMSPEQAAMSGADVDTRTDVYSLGVLLYESLTGTTPFDTHRLLKAGLDETRRVIASEEPVRPSTRLNAMNAAELTLVAQRRQAEPPKLIRNVRGDLDWIVIKALEKDRNRRYHTVSALADDVRRHLAHEPIAARPPGNWYKFWKLVRRNKLWFGVVTVAVAVLAIALGMVTAALNREKIARRDAEQTRQQALADKHQAKQEAARSMQVTCFLEEMLGSVGPSVALGRDATMMREILDKTASRLDAELPGQPIVEADLRMQLGKTYSELGQYQASERMLRRALALRTQWFGEENEGTSDAMNELGFVLNLQGESREAETLIRQALGVRRRLFGNEHLKVAISTKDLGAVLWRQDRLPESEAALRESLRIYRQCLGEDDAVIGKTLIGLGSVLYKQGEHQKAEEQFRKAMDALEKAVGQDHYAVASAMHNLAGALNEQQKYADAELFYRRVLSIRQKIYGEGHPLFANTLYSLAHCLACQGKYAESEAGFHRAFELARNRAEQKDEDVAESLQGLVRVLFLQRKFEEAEKRLAAVLPPGRELNPKFFGLLRDRTESFARRGRWKEAVQDATLLLEREPHEHLNYHTVAPLLVQAGDIDAYRDLCQKILAQFANATDPYVADRMAKDCLILPVPGLDLARVAGLAEVSISQGANLPALPFFHMCKALAEYRQGHFANAVEWASKSVGNPFPYSATESYAVLAMAHCRLQQYDAARAAFANGVALEAKLPKLESGDLGNDWRDWIIANALLAEAKTLLERVPSPGPTTPSK